jgi:hypothetical protein
MRAIQILVAIILLAIAKGLGLGMIGSTGLIHAFSAGGSNHIIGGD